MCATTKWVARLDGRTALSSASSERRRDICCPGERQVLRYARTHRAGCRGKLVPMAIGRPKAVLVLDAEQREQLESFATSRSLPAGLVCRAKIMLLSASGKTSREIARSTRLDIPNLSKVQMR
jgi:hypothetical protein